jgi:hypothetical protein
MRKIVNRLNQTFLARASRKIDRSFALARGLRAGSRAGLRAGPSRGARVPDSPPLQMLRSRFRQYVTNLCTSKTSRTRVQFQNCV